MKNLFLLLLLLPLSCLSYVLAGINNRGSDLFLSSSLIKGDTIDILDILKDTTIVFRDTTFILEGSRHLLSEASGDTIYLNLDSSFVHLVKPFDSAIVTDEPVKNEVDYIKGRIWRTAVMDEAVALYSGQKYEAAYKKFRQAGEYGEGAAYYFIGRMYQYGELKRSIQMPDSAEPGNPELYYIQSNDSARFYYKLALEENSLLGNLGLAELTIIRTKDDWEPFLRLMRSAAVDIREKAVEGDPFCTRILGNMYYTGFGEMQDLEYAFLYLSKAAEKNDVASYVALANLYLSGEGVKKNEEKAVYWLKKGVDAGDKAALYTLGLVYEEGLAGTVDPDQARELYHTAIRKGSRVAFEQLKYLNQTPDQKLIIASFTRNNEMLAKSLAAGAGINNRAVPEGYDQDFRNRTPLMHAVYIPVLLEDFGVIYEPEVRKHAISFLLKNKADVNATDQDGKTAMHYTLLGARISTDFFELEQAEILDTLLHYGADPNRVDKEGNPPLYYALMATNGQHEMELGRLLAGGANPNIQNEQGKTPLMLACELKASNEVILSLLKAGANPRIRDKKGKAAIDYTSFETVVNILMAAGSPEARK